MVSRITHSDKFAARSDSGKVRIIVCSEELIARGGYGGTEYYVPTGLKQYHFEDGEPAAKIGDSFLDCSGEIYHRIEQ